MSPLQAQACEGMPHGVPLSPEAMRAAMDTFSTLDPKDLEDMVSTMQGSAGVSSSSNASDTATLNPQLDQFRQAATALQVTFWLQLSACLPAVNSDWSLLRILFSPTHFQE